VYAILTNLVKNAIKYSKEGAIEIGYILKTDSEVDERLVLSEVEVSRIPQLEFYVKDSGIGIPKDRQHAIFDRFVQADIEDEMARQGAGLGLAITKSYVEMLGGKIRVESEEDKGSCFYFTLPYNAESEEKRFIHNDKFSLDEKLHISNLKILIAEDDETSNILISINVKDISKEILIAATGKEAVEICRNNPDIDLILMDIQMPDLNGFKATRLIREFNKKVVIIAQTAYALSGDREKAIEAGCNDYITKPIKKKLLLEMIDMYFNK
jgi:CheY-like chemotaxis protein